MLVYVSNHQEFTENVQRDRITPLLQSSFREKLGTNPGRSEVASWHDSLVHLDNTLAQAQISPDAGIAVEFQIPLTSKRVDVLISGTDQAENRHVVIVELKGWESAQPTLKNSIVKTALGGSLVETIHPSYQAWSYATFIEDFNEAVRLKSIQLQPCSFLHNCDDPSILKSTHYAEDLDRAPLFLGNERSQLAAFIASFIHKGDNAEALYEIENGRLKPSKHLVSYLASLIQGNDEFTLLDQQKIVAESILELDRNNQTDKRQVLIVDGGPGTGKSVLAINLLGKLTEQERVVQYVTRNNAPRSVFEKKLTGVFKRSRINNLFSSSGRFTQSPPMALDALLVDEAHRLSPKSGPFGNLGENQVKEIIHASKLSVFFLDEKQKVILRDIGSADEIRKWASYYNADVTGIKLESQFRCNGSDRYLTWLDQVLELEQPTDNEILDLNYDFRVFDSPTELFELIETRNSESESARMLAGYCWKWKSRQNKQSFDIEFPEFNFKKRWNLTEHGMLWITTPDSINEIGCIHTCQGLELEYVGVIVGQDFVVRNGRIQTDYKRRAPEDKRQIFKGIDTRLEEDPQGTLAAADRIIKNTYRTLLTRGMKGCYIYCVDEETNRYFKEQLPTQNA